MIVAIDANVIVYAMTGASRVHGPTHAWLTRVDEAGALVITSALSRLECYVRPRRLARPEEALLFSRFFERIIVLPVGEDVLDIAASIRAASRSYRTPDAIHLASAKTAQADVFLTADRRLKSFKEVRVIDVLRERPETLRL